MRAITESGSASMLFEAYATKEAGLWRGQLDEGSTPPRERGASTLERKASCVMVGSCK